MHHRIEYFQYLIDKKTFIIANENESIVYIGWDLAYLKKLFPLAVEKRNIIQQCIVDQLKEYFKGDRKSFKLKTKFYGTSFQKQVWQEIGKVDFGFVTTYGELAQKIGRPKASRAVGAALGKNPISIIYPCHRIIGKNGSLTGFAGGVDLKKRLLSIEKTVLS